MKEMLIVDELAPYTVPKDFDEGIYQSIRKVLLSVINSCCSLMICTIHINHITLICIKDV